MLPLAIEKADTIESPLPLPREGIETCCPITFVTAPKLCLLYHFPERGLKPLAKNSHSFSTRLLYHFPERGLKLHLLEIFPFLCNARIYALRRKKPGFLPNLWTTTKYFRKKTRFLGPYLASLPLPQEGIDIKSRGIGINLTHSQETAVPFVVST